MFLKRICLHHIDLTSLCISIKPKSHVGLSIFIHTQSFVKDGAGELECTAFTPEKLTETTEGNRNKNKLVSH